MQVKVEEKPGASQQGVTYHPGKQAQKASHSLHTTTLDKYQPSSSQIESRKRPLEESNRETDRPKARNYLETVRHHLTKDEYKEFQTSLKSYKLKTLPILSLIDKVTQLFCKKPGPLGLDMLKGFSEYIPRKHQAAFATHVLDTKRKMGL